MKGREQKLPIYAKTLQLNGSNFHIKCSIQIGQTKGQVLNQKCLIFVSARLISLPNHTRTQCHSIGLPHLPQMWSLGFSTSWSHSCTVSSGVPLLVTWTHGMRECLMVYTENLLMCLWPGLCNKMISKVSMLIMLIKADFVCNMVKLWYNTMSTCQISKGSLV